MGGLLLSSQGCYVNANDQECELEPVMGLKYKPPRNRAVGLLTALNTGRSDAPVILTGRWTSASGRVMCAMCHRLQTPIARFQRSIDDRTRQLESDRTLDLWVQSFPVRFQTRHFMPDRTHPASDHSTSPLCAPRQCSSALTGRTLPASGHF